jgi:hypothetical protein
MNIHDIDNLINSLDKIKDKDLIKFYKTKRAELVKQIFTKATEAINKLNK